MHVLEKLLDRWRRDNILPFSLQSCIWRPGVKCAVQVAEILVADLGQSVVSHQRVGGGKLILQAQHLKPFPYFSCHIMLRRKAIVELQVKPQLPVVEVGEILIQHTRLHRIIPLSQLCKGIVIVLKAALGRDKEQLLAVIKQGS